MSELQSALSGATGGTAVQVAEAGLCGMITLRGDLADTKLHGVCKALTGVDVPEQRQIALRDTGGIAWMSPDELLILLDHDKAADGVATLNDQLEGHFLAVNVSDARAVFTLTGAAWRDVVARLSPMDMRGFGTGEVRRTRFAQIPAAIWQSGDDQATIVCFRSVAQYMFDLLDNAAKPGAL